MKTLRKEAQHCQTKKNNTIQNLINKKETYVFYPYGYGLQLAKKKLAYKRV